MHIWFCALIKFHQFHQTLNFTTQQKSKKFLPFVHVITALVKIWTESDGKKGIWLFFLKTHLIVSNVQGIGQCLRRPGTTNGQRWNCRHASTTVSPNCSCAEASERCPCPMVCADAVAGGFGTCLFWRVLGKKITTKLISEEFVH